MRKACNHYRIIGGNVCTRSSGTSLSLVSPEKRFLFEKLTNMFKLKKFESIALAVAFIISSPAFASADTISDLQAQVQALLAQIAALQQQLGTVQNTSQNTNTAPSQTTSTSAIQPTSGKCIILSSNIGADDTDDTTRGDVTRLQKFLTTQYDNFFDRYVTGYFGPMTEAAVKQWQREHGLVSSGDANSTGWGYIGPRTRAALAQGCGMATTVISNPDVQPFPGVTPTLPVPEPRIACPVVMRSACPAGTHYEYGPVSYDSNNCPSQSATCVPDTQPTPPPVQKCGVNTFSVQNQCGASFRNVYFQCYDGYSQTLGDSTSCKSSEVWQEHARNACADRCSGPSKTPIIVTAPNGGEQWEQGIMNTVTWTPYQYNPDINPSRDVTAYLETQSFDGTAYKTLGKVQENGKASIHWTTGQLDAASNGGNNYALPGQYYIRVVNNVTGATNRSDAAFTITPRSVDVKVNGSDGPMTVNPSDRVRVSWTSTGKNSCTIFGVSDTPVSGGSTQPRMDNMPTSGTRDVYVWFWDPSYGTSVGAQCADSSGNVMNDWVNINATPQSASVRITSPNGGEALSLTTPTNIFWTQSGISRVSIALYKNDQWKQWLVKDMSSATEGNKNSYYFDPLTISDAPALPGMGNVFKIYITAQRNDGTGYVDDKSDGTFSFTTGAVNAPTCKLYGTPGANTMTGASGFTLSWVTVNASTATLTGGAMNLNTGVPVTGNQFGQPTEVWVSQSGTYTLTVNGSGGSGTCSTTVGSQSSGTLSVSAGQQPPNSLAPQGTIIPFTTFKLINNGSAPVSIASIVVNNSGMIADGAFHGVRVDVNGMPYEVDNSVFNSSHQAVVLTPGLTVQSGQNIGGTISGLMATDLSAYAGQAGRLDLGGITTSAFVSGSLPISGATQTINASLDACSSPDLYYTYGYKCWTTTVGTQQTTVTSISPTAGGNGTQVVITGAGFGTSNYINLVLGNHAYAVGSYVPSTNGGTVISLSFAFPGSLDPGVYTVQVCNGGGGGACSNSPVTFTVTGSTQTSLSFVATPASGQAPLTVTGSYNRFDCATNYFRLEWGDGSSSSVNYGERCGERLGDSHTYAQPGTYTAVLNRYTQSGCSGECRSTATITVSAAQPTPTFSAWPNSGTAPLTSYLTMTGVSSPSAYSVAFGDGTNGSSWTADETQGTYFTSHSFASPGTYTAILMYQPPAVPCNAPPGAACMAVLPPPVQVGTATITVGGSAGGVGVPWGGTVSSSGTNSNLANALTALEATLKALLGQFAR